MKKTIKTLNIEKLELESKITILEAQIEQLEKKIEFELMCKEMAIKALEFLNETRDKIKTK